MSNDCCHKTRPRTPEELAPLQNRLRRIEGQVRGLQKMLAEDAYCTDVLTQVSAVQSALGAFSAELLDTHIRTCVVRDVRAGDDAVVDDLVRTMRKLLR